MVLTVLAIGLLSAVLHALVVHFHFHAVVELIHLKLVFVREEGLLVVSAHLVQ